MANEMKPSEVMQNFLDYMKSCQREYQICMVEVHKHDKRVQDFLHGLEFAGNRQERNRIATQVSQSRKDRRRLKDRMQLLEGCARLFGDKSNKQFFDRLQNLIEKQRKEEEFLESDRIYKSRAGDDV